jgi:hypothetical protein
MAHCKKKKEKKEKKNHKKIHPQVIHMTLQEGRLIIKDI